MDEEQQLAAALAALIAGDRPEAGGVSIAGLSRVVGGNSSEIWRFDARWRDGDRENGGAFILRRGSRNEFGSAGRVAEFRLLRALSGEALPTPRAFWLDPDGSVLDRPAMVLERLPGLADRNLFRANNRFGLGGAARRRVAVQVAESLAAIHRIDLATFDLPDQMRASGHPAEQQLAYYDREISHQEVEPMPELRLASLWLHEHLPSRPRCLTLVHGDYRPANFLIQDGGISALLDWEFAHEGDPAEDIGWYLTAYYAHEHFIPDLWNAEDFLACYAAASGHPVDRAAVHFWSVFAMYKLASMTIAALSAATAGDVSRLAPSARFIIDPLLRGILDRPAWAGDAG